MYLVLTSLPLGCMTVVQVVESAVVLWDSTASQNRGWQESGLRSHIVLPGGGVLEDGVSFNWP